MWWSSARSPVPGSRTPRPVRCSGRWPQRDVRPDHRPRRRIGPVHRGVRHHVPVDLATGKARRQTNLAVRVFNAVVVVADGVVWAQSADGKLLRVRLPDGTPPGRLQHSLACSSSTSAIAGGTLVVGGQNGVVAGIELRNGDRTATCPAHRPGRGAAGHVPSLTPDGPQPPPRPPGSEPGRPPTTSGPPTSNGTG
ncbi:PQQ-binding-like beta-propeller repeat protein [Streptomyces sp. NPDC057950]|uniref:outer membrane protein assembly factor BamB family protein n=1 Tax=Streptomyces sp. NPDC057950 TaxID=3346288 RepID=UPI0036E1C732